PLAHHPNLHSFPTRRSSDLELMPSNESKACSISPNSIRCPLILTWSSILPRQCTSPEGNNLAKSPVRYNTGPNSVSNGFFINFSDRKSTRLNSSHVKISYAV